jgi:hypothetical protein
MRIRPWSYGVDVEYNADSRSIALRVWRMHLYTAAAFYDRRLVVYIHRSHSLPYHIATLGMDSLPIESSFHHFHHIVHYYITLDPWIRRAC